MFNDGGPAFARSGFYTGDDGPADYDACDQEGMSLWDFYAAMDLPVSSGGDWLGWFGDKAIVDAFGKPPQESSGLDKLTWLAMIEAGIRGLRADAMIAEREKRRAEQPST